MEQQQLFADEPERPSVTQGLLGSYVESYHAQAGNRPPARVLGQVAATVNELVKGGAKVTHIEQALDVMVTRALRPSILPQLVAEVDLKEATQRARDWVARKGWPTGWRFKRSAASGMHVKDTLGYDWPPPGYGLERPTYEEIEEALRGKDEDDKQA